MRVCVCVCVHVCVCVCVCALREGQSVGLLFFYIPGVSGGAVLGNILKNYIIYVHVCVFNKLHVVGYIIINLSPAEPLPIKP